MMRRAACTLPWDWTRYPAYYLQNFHYQAGPPYLARHIIACHSTFDSVPFTSDEGT